MPPMISGVPLRPLPMMPISNTQSNSSECLNMWLPFEGALAVKASTAASMGVVAATTWGSWWTAWAPLDQLMTLWTHPDAR
jgi:hypothetical protein